MKRTQVRLRLFAVSALLLLIQCDSQALQPQWESLAPAPVPGGNGQAIVGTSKGVFLLRQMNVNDLPTFALYDLQEEGWVLLTLQGDIERYLRSRDMPFRNGTALAWDNGRYLYVLVGARYSDPNRRLFFRYDIPNNSWEELPETLGPQGAGDALAFSAFDGKLYALTGSNRHRGVFARFDPASRKWEELPFPPEWDCTDDGASLVAVGEYVYALKGECEELTPNGDFARYHIPTGEWEALAELPATRYWDPENPSEPCGVGDGGTLVWAPEMPQFLFATDGGCADETYGKGFWRYSIPADEWVTFGVLPAFLGHYNGARFAYSEGAIYGWVGGPTLRRDRPHSRNPLRGKGFARWRLR